MPEYYGKRNWLTHERCKKGLRQIDVAELLNISVDFVQQIEYGIKMPGLAVAIKYADLLEFDVRMFTERNIEETA